MARRRPLTARPTAGAAPASAPGPGSRSSTPSSPSRRSRPCAVLALRWLARHAGHRARPLRRGRQRDGRGSSGSTGLGLPLAAVDAFSLDLDDRTHPLVVALAGSEPVAFHGSGWPGRCGAVRDAAGRRAVPRRAARRPGEQRRHRPRPPAARPARRRRRSTRTCAGRPRCSGVRLQSLWYRRAQVDERRHKRERSWLFGIINAVTDPILLTDADGRILVANAGAEMLLTADDQKSEGRRRAVALNNMLFSASLFTTGGGGGPTRQRAAAGRPDRGPGPAVRGASRTPVEIRVGETGIVSVLRNVTDLRRATEEIEENYRRLRAAEAETRAERDRLDLILNSVARSDPGDRSGGQHRAHEPAGGAHVHRRPGRQRAPRPSAGCGPTTRCSPRSSRQPLSPSQSLRWRGELTLIDPETGATVPVEAISGKVLSQARRGRRPSSPSSTT